MAIKLAQEVNGQKVGETYSGPAALLNWLKLEGYVYDDAAAVSHISTSAALPADDPTLAVNREPFNDLDDGASHTQKYSGNLLQAEVTSITPATGVAAGGGTVVLVGDGLIDVTAITFGGTPATQIDTGNDKRITCKVPAHAAGAVTVAVTDSRGTTSKPTFYTYT